MTHQRTIEDVFHTIFEGEFYSNYDESVSDLGILRAAIQRIRDLEDALKPFGKVDTKELTDDRSVETTVTFNREEAEELNQAIDERNLPIKKADLENGFNFAKHILSLDDLHIKHFRRARELVGNTRFKKAVE